MFKLHLLFLFGLSALAASASTSECAQLKKFNLRFERTYQESPVNSFPETSGAASDHERRTELREYMSYVSQQTANIGALVHSLKTPSNGQTMTPAESKIEEILSALRQKVTEMDSQVDSDSPLTAEEEELSREASDVSSSLKQLRDSMDAEVDAQCQEQRHTTRQLDGASGALGGVTQALGGNTDILPGARGGVGALENIPGLGKTAQGVVNSIEDLVGATR